jgi:hypothetical protein
MAADAAGAMIRTGGRRLRRPGWLAVIVVAGLAAVYLTAIGSTHATLTGGFVGWSGVVPRAATGLAWPTAAQREQIGPLSGYSEVLWASRPGGEVIFGFQIHNAGPVPVTVLSLALHRFDPRTVGVFAPAGAQLGPGFGQMKPFHPVTLGPGGTVPAGLTERVICAPIIRADARLPGDPAATSVVADSTSPVVVRYRALGITMSQALSLATPVMVALPYRACK